MTGKQRRSLGGLIGQRVKVLRRKRGMTQDELARYTRETVGYPPMTRNVLAALEAGRTQASLVDLVALSMALRVPLAELFEFEDRVAIGERGVPVWIRVLSAAVSGQAPGELPKRLGPVADEEIPRGVRLAVEALDLVETLLPDPEDRGDLRDVAKNELEQHLARQLDVDPHAVAAAALHLWGRSATEERDRRHRETGRGKQHVSRDLRRDIESLVAQTREARG